MRGEWRGERWVCCCDCAEWAGYRVWILTGMRVVVGHGDVSFVCDAERGSRAVDDVIPSSFCCAFECLKVDVFHVFLTILVMYGYHIDARSHVSLGMFQCRPGQRRGCS